MEDFTLLYEMYKKDIYYYLYSLCKDPSLSEDLLSETFLQAYISLASLKKEDAVKTWLLSIAHRKFLTYCRKHKVQIPLEEYMQATNTSSDMANRIALMKHFISLKDTKTQTLFQMRLEGYPYAIIAKKLQISENACRVMDFRLKQWLKQQIEKEETKYE